MSIKTHHIIVSLFIGAIALASLAWLGIQAPTALATCSTGASITVNAPGPNQTLSGSTNLWASTSGSSAQPQNVTFMITAPTQLALGNVGPSGSSGTDWALSWDSRSVPDGSYQLVAVAHYGTNTTYDCLSAAVPINIYNSTAAGSQSPTLSASISPGSWEGLPGQNQQFSVTGVYTDQLGVQHPATPANGATYQWGTNAGSLSANGGPSINLVDGPATGTFNVGVVVKMNGLSVSKSVPVKIVLSTSGTSGSGPSPSPTPAPTISDSSGDGSGTPLTAAQIQVLSTTPTIFRPTKATNSDPVVPVQTLGCLEQKLGTKFTQISSGQVQPTTDDRLKGSACFSGSNKIPSTLAPVDPNHIADLPTTSDLVTLDSLKNETITGKSGNKVTAILLSGSGTPNSSVFLFIFSDPMVLRAQTDGQGKWSYVLENPLKPGHHEFYAVSQKDSSSFVRTPAVPVSIAAASPGSTDGSLIIEHSLTPAQIGYIAGAVVMVLAALILLLRLLRRRAKAPAATPAPAAATTAQPAATPAPAAAAPTAAPAPDQPAPENHDVQA